MCIRDRHYVVQSNDTHEISNYRLATHMARALGCRHAVLLQDDDIYSNTLFDWVDRALAMMSQDKSIVIVGGNGGVNFVPARCRRADNGLTSAHFEMWRAGNERRSRLGDYQEMVFSGARATDGASPMEFVHSVNRAPQIIQVEAAIALGFFPVELEPYQYDDDFNCLKAWSSGKKVLHMPIGSQKGKFGRGGMRLYNGVTVDSRPPHFCRNWNYILDTFATILYSGELETLTQNANALTPHREQSNDKSPQ